MLNLVYIPAVLSAIYLSDSSLPYKLLGLPKLHIHIYLNAQLELVLKIQDCILVSRLNF